MGCIDMWSPPHARMFEWLLGTRLQPGDTGYFNPRSLGNVEWLTSQIPLMSNIQSMFNSADYYNDYEKNTGIRPRYPGLSYHNTGGVSAFGHYLDFRGTNWWD